MIDYVNGLGDYWIRLVEQMVPASTFWNTGFRYENSIFHRQKFVWWRQEGCQLIPIPCRPCSLTTTIFEYDCPKQQGVCDIYPSESFGVILSNTLNSYLSPTHNLVNCNLDGLLSEWFIDLRVDNVSLVQNYFFTGHGLSNPVTSIPNNSMWLLALTDAMNIFVTYGYDYYFVFKNNTLVVYNSSCSDNMTGINFKINIGINFNILCK
jgi:hypothetical protein